MHFVWAMLLFVMTILMFSVPLWPAFWELRRKSSLSLSIDRSDDGSPKYAASLKHGANQPVLEQYLVLAHGTVSLEVICATESIKVQPHCEFTWLDAQTVEFVALNSATEPTVAKNKTTPDALGGSSEKFQRIQGQWQTSPCAQVHGDYVVTQDVLLTQGTTVWGNIKSYCNVYIAEGAVVHGSVFAKKDIVLREGAVVFGVVSAGQKITMLASSVVGHVTQLSSVTAPRVQAHAGARVHGSVKAQILGVSSV